jgi:hypothetical protein
MGGVFRCAPTVTNAAGTTQRTKHPIGVRLERTETLIRLRFSLTTACRLYILAVWAAPQRSREPRQGRTLARHSVHGAVTVTHQ